MAQQVSYFEDNVKYEEGPFVLTEIWGDYRIEVEIDGQTCPALPASEIYALLDRHGFQSKKTYHRELIATAVDWLNLQAANGVIAKRDGRWMPVA